jgi:hypothetical protein
MAKFWFVSRERFEDERHRCEKLEAELDRLRELLIPGLRQPVPPPAPAEVAPIVLTEGTDFETIQPISGRPTIAQIVGKANRAALDRTKVPGDTGIAQELAEQMRKPVVTVIKPQQPPRTEDQPKAVNGD